MTLDKDTTPYASPKRGGNLDTPGREKFLGDMERSAAVDVCQIVRQHAYSSVHTHTASTYVMKEDLVCVASE